jgi:hypothetical protein
MKLSGWIFMVLSRSLIIGIMIFAYRMVLRKKPNAETSGKAAGPDGQTSGSPLSGFILEYPGADGIAGCALSVL